MTMSGSRGHGWSLHASLLCLESNHEASCVSSLLQDKLRMPGQIMDARSGICWAGLIPWDLAVHAKGLTLVSPRMDLSAAARAKHLVDSGPGQCLLCECAGRYVASSGI